MDEAVDQLYALDPADFVAARNELARRLRKEGDRALAGEVAKLRRPSPAAWAVNQLARRHRAELEELVRLGEQLRAAQEAALAGDASVDLRRATRARRDAVSRLAQTAEELFAERGAGGAAHAAEVVATLEAASLDEAAGVAVLAGRLTEELHPPSGFGVFDAPPAAVRDRPAPESAPAHDDRAARARRDAEEAVADARRRWEERSAKARDAVADVAERRRTVEEAEAELRRLDDLVIEAQRRLRSATREAGAAEDAASRAEDAATRAARDVREAEERLARVTDR